jgi:hypothetical protein
MLDNNNLGLCLVILCLAAVYACYSKKTTAYNENSSNSSNSEPFIGYNYNLHSVEDVSKEYQDDDSNEDSNIPVLPNPRTGEENAALIMRKLGLIQEIIKLKEDLGERIGNKDDFVSDYLHHRHHRLKSIINNLRRMQEPENIDSQQMPVKESFTNTPQNLESIVEEEEDITTSNTNTENIKNNVKTIKDEQTQSQEQSKIFGGTHLSRKKTLLNELNKNYFDCDNDLLNKILLPKKGELFIKSL